MLSVLFGFLIARMFASLPHQTCVGVEKDSVTYYLTPISLELPLVMWLTLRPLPSSFPNTLLRGGLLLSQQSTAKRGNSMEN